MIVLDDLWNPTTSATPKVSLCDSCINSCKVDRKYNCQTCLVIKCDRYKSPVDIDWKIGPKETSMTFKSVNMSFEGWKE